MKKMLTTRNLFFISIFSMLIFCLMAPPSFSAPKSSKSAPKTSKSESPSYSTTPFDDTWKSLPQNYNGHDVVAVHKSVSKNLDIKKDEFETEAQFEIRRKEAWEKPILGKMTANDNFAFVYEPEKMYDAEKSQFTIKIENFQNIGGVILKESRIGEDKRGQETLKRIHRDEKRKKIMRGKATYTTDTAATLLGAAIEEAGIREIFTVHFSEEDWPMLQQISVDMQPEEARKNNEIIRVLFVGGIVGHLPRKAAQFSIFSCYTNSLKLGLKKVIIFNYQTGEIYRTIEFGEQGRLQNPVDYFRRGNSYMKLKKYNEAMNDYNKAIELAPKSAGLYFARGYCYAKLKQCNEAMRDLNKAIELDPKQTESYDLVRKICYGN